MTIFDAQKLLFSYFTKSDCFDYKSFVKSETPIWEDEEEFKQIILAALSGLASVGICQEIAKDKYVLMKPLSHNEREFKVDYTTSTVFCNEYNKLAGELGLKQYLPHTLDATIFTYLCILMAEINAVYKKPDENN